MEFMKTQFGSLVSEMDAMQAMMDFHHEEMMAKMDACRGVMPARLEEEEPAQEETKAVAEPQEVTEEATDEETIVATEDRSRNLRLAAGCGGRLKTRTKRDGQLRQDCAATVGRPTRRFIPALRKGGLRKGPGRMCRRSCIRGRSKTSCDGMREIIGKQRRLLERKKTHTEAISQKLDVKIAKLTFESSVRYWKMGDWLLWKCRPLLKRKR
jgi:hypothetical protein